MKKRKREIQIKTAFIVSLCFLILSSCDNIMGKELYNSTSQLRTLKIKLNEKVNDYLVTIYWKPLKMSDHGLTGPAIFTFEKDQHTSTVATNYFSLKLDKNDFTLDKENYVNSLSLRNITVDYVGYNFENKNKETTNCLFFFQDIDFDNKDELLITELEQGSLGLQAFKPYKVGNNEFMEMSWQKKGISPYERLDVKTSINSKTKTLTNFGYDDYCGDPEYKYAVQNGIFQNIEIVSYETSLGVEECLKIVYKVENGVSTIVSKTSASYKEKQLN